ncbi:UNVERIFIED_CONTAM: hypothetical protein Sradi_1224600 [Sesamum radiatum]|uniref:Uncharacterized protein n=1 Tax=Sesamum radiatum TaxID=300843 RepID=A0AAW2UQ14_SESRA
MPQAPTVRSSAYLNALTLEIEKKLQRALASATQRPNLLQELFADIALEVDDRAKRFTTLLGTWGPDCSALCQQLPCGRGPGWQSHNRIALGSL